MQASKYEDKYAKVRLNKGGRAIQPHEFRLDFQEADRRRRHFRVRR